MTRHAPGAGPGDRGAEGAHGGGGGEHVLAFEQAFDRGFADGERPQHQRAVRDRLVARRPDRARERPGSPGAERPRGSSVGMVGSRSAGRPTVFAGAVRIA